MSLPRNLQPKPYLFRVWPEAQMTDFVPSGYITLEQAVDRIGAHLMPRQWLGHEVDLLKRDSNVTDALTPPGERVTTMDTQVGRLNRAMARLLHVLAVATVKAVVSDEDGGIRAFPPSLWAKPGVRAAFHSGELPDEFRVALEGHKAGAGRRWLLIPELELRGVLKGIAETQAVSDIRSDLRAWLVKKVEQVAAEKAPTKKRTWMEAQSHFGTALSYRTFDQVWHATVPDTWKRPLRERRIKPAG
jgi:hypothetical protein